jgi:hypothetical protein
MPSGPAVFVTFASPWNPQALSPERSLIPPLIFQAENLPFLWKFIEASCVFHALLLPRLGLLNLTSSALIPADCVGSFLG